MTLPPRLREALSTADHTDTLSVESDAELRPFVARTLSFHPRWLQALYRVRVVLLAALGQKTGLPPQTAPLGTLPTQPAERAAFFTLEEAGPDHWTAWASEAHLTARLAVLQSPGEKRRFLYRLVTVVHFHNRVGRVYFAVIRPFHVLVVRAMLRHGARQPAGTLPQAVPKSARE